jgi:hypothetical protein
MRADRSASFMSGFGKAQPTPMTGYFLIPVQCNINYDWGDRRWFVFMLDRHTRAAVAIRFACSLILLGGAIVCFFLSFGRCLLIV